MNDNYSEAAKKAINTPFMTDFPENTLRIRRNLIAVSGLVLFYKLGGLTIDPKSAFFGFKFTELTPNLIDSALFILVGYLWLHFLCNSFSYIHEFRLRATGAKVALEELAESIATFDGGLKINNVIADDPRQTTLLTWLDQHQTELAGLTKGVRKLFKNMENDNHQNVDNIENGLKAIENEIRNMDMLKIGLEQFGRSFVHFFWMQLFRWLILEWLLPLAVGALAVVFLLYR